MNPGVVCVSKNKSMWVRRRMQSRWRYALVRRDPQYAVSGRVGRHSRTLTPGFDLSGFYSAFHRHGRYDWARSGRPGVCL